MSIRNEILVQIPSIPQLPPVGIDLMGILSDPYVDIHVVGKLIEHDPGLTANVLRLANSATVRGWGEIDSVRAAVTRLGMKRVIQLALTSVTSDALSKPINGYGLSACQLWNHSVAVAVGTEYLLAGMDVSPPVHAFTAGLLHDIGKIVLGTFVDVNLENILSCAFENNISFDSAERQVLGIDHAEVGAALAEEWGFPAEIVDVVRWHHNPECASGDRLAVDVVHIADVLSIEGGLGLGTADGLQYRCSSAALKRRHINTKRREETLCHMMVTLEELRDAFNLEGAEN